MALHRAFYKLERGLAIPPLAGKDLKHLAFVIHGAPQVVRLPIDPDEHFIQMPPPLRMTSMLLNTPLPAANIGPNRFHQYRTVSWQISTPRSNGRSSTCRNDSG